jgi:hypothetical protein
MRFTSQLLKQPSREQLNEATAPTFGPFRIVQPSHVRASLRELTQDQALTRAKQDARCPATRNLLIRRDAIAADRRFTGEPLTDFGDFS